MLKTNCQKCKMKFNLQCVFILFLQLKCLETKNKESLENRLLSRTKSVEELHYKKASVLNRIKVGNLNLNGQDHFNDELHSRKYADKDFKNVS